MDPNFITCTCLPQVHEETASLIRHLLKSKNIIVLQEVYSHLTEIYESALMAIADIKPFLKKSISNRKAIQENEKGNNALNPAMKRSYPQHRYTRNEAESVICFLLECLSNLVNAKGSVLSLWALDPSIFSLLINHSGLLEKVS